MSTHHQCNLGTERLATSHGHEVLCIDFEIFLLQLAVHVQANEDPLHIRHEAPIQTTFILVLLEVTFLIWRRQPGLCDMSCGTRKSERHKARWQWPRLYKPIQFAPLMPFEKMKTP
jgi:hypothetical protein